MKEWLLDNLVAIFAVGISFVAFFKSRYVEGLVAELTQKQIEQLDEDIEDRQKVKIRYIISETARGSKKLVVQNVGEVTAYDFKCDMVTENGEEACARPLSKYPIREFSRNSNTEILMPLAARCSLGYYVTSRWMTADKKAGEYKEYVTFGG